MSKKRLTKSRNNRVFSGVVGGLAEFTGIDSTILRIGFIILSSSGITIPVYLLLMIIMPEAGYSSDSRAEQFDERERYDTIYKGGRTDRKEARRAQEDEWSDF